MANIQFLGKLGKDAEVKDVNGTAVAQFSVAETVGFGDKKQSIWYDCSLWGKQAQSSFIDYLSKGREVVVFGELTTHEHNGKTYLKVRIQDIKLTSGTKDSNQGQQQPAQQGYAQPKQQIKQQQGHAPQNGGGEIDDDLPFAPIDHRTV